MDGHSGIKNEKVNEGSSGNFSLILSALEESSGTTYFVIHATSNTSYSGGLQPLEFLQGIGLQHFPGRCPFYHAGCFWKVIAEVERDSYGRADNTQRVHEAFQQFAGRIGKLFDLSKEQVNIVESLRLNCPPPSIFGQPAIFRPELKGVPTDPKNIPSFVNDVKFEKLKGLEEQEKRIHEEIEDLREYIPLLYGDEKTGLKSAVIKALKFFGLNAEPTKKGFTVDILAETIDGSMKFGFEVTGVSGQIKKDSNKLTQVAEFERIKEHGEKTVLLANTYKGTPVKERSSENFTPQVVSYLSGWPILMMTGLDLYQMVRDAMENGKDPCTMIKLLYETKGVLKYP